MNIIQKIFYGILLINKHKEKEKDITFRIYGNYHTMSALGGINFNTIYIIIISFTEYTYNFYIAILLAVFSYIIHYFILIKGKNLKEEFKNKDYQDYKKYNKIGVVYFFATLIISFLVAISFLPPES